MLNLISFLGNLFCCHAIFSIFWTAAGPMNSHLFVHLSIRPFVIFFFFLDNHSKDFSDFVYGYGALWVGLIDSPFSGQNSNLANNGGKQQKTTKNNTFLDFDKKTALEIFLIFGMMLVEMILYHSIETTCPGKSWFSSFGLKSSWPIRLLNYFFRL